MVEGGCSNRSITPQLNHGIVFHPLDHPHSDTITLVQRSEYCKHYSNLYV